MVTWNNRVSPGVLRSSGLSPFYVVFLLHRLHRAQKEEGREGNLPMGSLPSGLGG